MSAKGAGMCRLGTYEFSMQRKLDSPLEMTLTNPVAASRRHTPPSQPDQLQPASQRLDSSSTAHSACPPT
jgi:hypothetical protein